MALNINAIFIQLLGRPATAAELSTYQAFDAANGDAATIQLLTQSDAVQQEVIPVIQIIQLATGLIPTAAQLEGWVAAVQTYISQGESLTQALTTVAQAWVSNSNFQAQYGTTSTSIINGIYAKAFGTTPTQAQINAWSVDTPAQILEAFATSTIFTNTAAPYINVFLAGVMESVSGAPGAVFPSGSLFGLPLAVTPVDLTIGVDAGGVYTASTAGAIFDATPGSNPPLGVANTLNVGDNLQDSVGDGTLNVTEVPTGINPAFAIDVTLNGISTANITNTSFGTAGFAGNITGLTTVTVEAGSNAGVALGLPGAGNGLHTALQNVNMNSSQNFTAWMNASALAGATDSVQITLTGPYGTAGTAKFVQLLTDTGSGNTYETVNIAADSASFLQLGAGGDPVMSTTSVVLSGAGAIQLSAGTATEYQNVTSIDASGNSGGVTITGASTGGMAGNRGFLDNAVLKSFQGGSGNDLVDISHSTPAQVQAMTLLDGGDGRDTFVVAGVVLNATAALPDTNFEIIAANNIAGTVDWSKLGANIDTVQVLNGGNVGGNVLINNAANGGTLAFGTADINGHNLTVNGPAGLTDVFNVTATAHNVFTPDFGAVTFNGLETVNFTISGVAAGAPLEDIGSITMTPSAGGGSTLNLVDNSGDNAFPSVFIHGATNVTGFGVINVSGTGTGGVEFGGDVTAAKLDASGYAGSVHMNTQATGPISILGSNQSDILVGSTGADSINGGGGNDSIANQATSAISGSQNTAHDSLTGGAGNDTFILRGDTGTADPNLLTAYSATPVINDFSLSGANGSDVLALSENPFNYNGLTSGDVFSGIHIGGPGAGGVTVENIAPNVTSPIAGNADVLHLTQGFTEVAGMTAGDAWAQAIGTGTVSGVGVNKEIFFTMYDQTAGLMVVGDVNADGSGTLTATDDFSVHIIGTATMSQADYANFNADHFQIIA